MPELHITSEKQRQERNSSVAKQRDNYPQCVLSISQGMRWNNRSFRLILRSLCVAVTSPCSKALWSLDAFRSTNMNVRKIRACFINKAAFLSHPSRSLLSLSLLLALCLSSLATRFRQSMVADRSDDRAEQRADLPSYAVEEKMLRDSGILSPLSSQPLRSRSGRKSRRCVLTFGGTIMNIQELCWSCRVK